MAKIFGRNKPFFLAIRAEVCQIDKYRYKIKWAKQFYPQIPFFTCIV